MFAASKSGKAAAAAAATDASFAYVPLLLNTGSTNGQQNNTFLDSSTNAFTITRNGTPTQGSRTPYWPNGQWSNYFGATGQYLSIPYSSVFNLTGDFTVECWINCGNLPSTTSPVAQAYGRVFSFGTYNAANSFGLEINSNNAGFIRRFVSWYNGTSYDLSANNAVLPGVWYHIAVVRSGTTINFYINGTSTGLTITGASAAVNTSQAFYIASLQAFESDPLAAFNGYISNFRIVKGVAVYTGTFTPPTSPLQATQSSGTNISAITGTQTSLLTCQSNRFKDNSSVPVVVSVFGTPSVQAFQPFSPAASYSAATYAGSGYFNGSTDYLSLATSTAFGFGTGNYTIETWIYSPNPATGTIQTIVDLRNTTGPSPVQINLTATGFFAAYNGTTYTSSTAITGSTWNHIALVRNGSGANNCKLYVNGTQTAQFTDTSDYGSTHTCFIARNAFSAVEYFNGYMSNVRLVKGTAVYTTAFTPPTTPVTNVTNTSLLLNMANAGIYDAAAQNDITTVGDAQVSTAQSKWSPSSMRFDGTGDYLTLPSNQAFAFGSGNYTFECWVNSSVTSQQVIFSSGQTGTNNFYFSFAPALSYIGIGTQAVFILQATVTLTTNTWYYVAATRSSGVLKLFLNGTQVASGSDNTVWIQGGSPSIGSNASAGQLFNGYLQDLRITKGVARTITTVPSAAFPTR